MHSDLKETKNLAKFWKANPDCLTTWSNLVKDTPSSNKILSEFFLVMYEVLNETSST